MALPVVTWYDAVLILVVAVQATAIAYLPSPRVKAFLFTVPVPFTIVVISLGKPMGAMNILALLVVLLYTQTMRLLHQRLGLHIAPSIGLALIGFIALGWIGARLVVSTPAAFWASAAFTYALGLALYFLMPARAESPHRTLLPVWQKLPIVCAVVLLLVLVKESLQGFATLFPLLGVVGAYESRHSLWTLGRQVPVFIVSIVPLMVVTYLLQDRVGLPLALAAGWVVFLPMLLFFSRRHWRTNAAT